jgi:hypothetical protein
VKPFQHCIGCGWELIRDNQWRPKEYHCENKHCREDVFYEIDKWAFRSKAWEVSLRLCNGAWSEGLTANRNATSSTSTSQRSTDRATRSSSAYFKRYGLTASYFHHTRKSFSTIRQKRRTPFSCLLGVTMWIGSTTPTSHGSHPKHAHTSVWITSVGNSTIATTALSRETRVRVKMAHWLHW